MSLLFELSWLIASNVQVKFFNTRTLSVIHIIPLKKKYFTQLSLDKGQTHEL
jgi:hypothetical protein